MVELLRLTLSIYGLAILVSFLVAGLIALIVQVQARLRPSTSPSQPAPVTSTPTTPQASIPAHHLAAISAALAVVLDNHRIVHVRTRHGRSWNVEGRAQHHTSHNVPHRPRR